MEHNYQVGDKVQIYGIQIENGYDKELCHWIIDMLDVTGTVVHIRDKTNTPILVEYPATRIHATRQIEFNPQELMKLPEGRK